MKLKAGDTVMVNFNNIRYTLVESGRLIRIPTAAGDFWIVQDLADDTLHYISEPCTVTRLGKGE